MPDFQILNIGVVGAGIAGLGAAIALRQAGHRVEIFEKSRFNNEVGAAITTTPNATRILERWGCDFGKACALAVKQYHIFKHDDLKTLFTANYNMVSKFGAEWYVYHRVDLHTELKRLAFDTEGNAPLARVRLSAEVVDVNCEDGTLKLADGSSLQKDLIVAADGVHSRLVRHVTGADTPATPTGVSIFRGLVPTSKLLEDDRTRKVFEGVRVGMNQAKGFDRRFVWYPCRNGEIINFSAVLPDTQKQKAVEDWNVDASIEDLLTEFDGFHPALLEAWKKADDLKLWKLLSRKPIPQWYNGKVVLIGDAAHPMLPYHAQGAAQALEDTAALGMALSKLKSVEELPSRLHQFQHIRKDRASAVQIFSNVAQDEAGKIKELAEPYVRGPMPTNLEEFQQYNYSYNVFEACEGHSAGDSADMVPPSKSYE